MSTSAAELILSECFRSFCARPGARLVEQDGVIGAMTDVPTSFFNGIGAAQIESPEALARVIDVFKANGRPFRWWITPSMTPSDLPEQLQAHGMFHRWDSPGMVKMLTAETYDTPPGFTARIAAHEDMPLWTDVLVRGFNMAPEFLEIWTSAYEGGGFNAEAGWKHFIGFLDGEPAALTATLLRGELAGVYHVVTLPSARVRGLGKAIMRVAMDDARRRGATVAALQSSELGLHLYRSLGFEEHCMLRMYEWRPA